MVDLLPNSTATHRRHSTVVEVVLLVVLVLLLLVQHLNSILRFRREDLLEQLATVVVATRNRARHLRPCSRSSRLRILSCLFQALLGVTVEVLPVVLNRAQLCSSREHRPEAPNTHLARLVRNPLSISDILERFNPVIFVSR